MLRRASTSAVSARLRSVLRAPRTVFAATALGSLGYATSACLTESASPVASPAPRQKRIEDVTLRVPAKLSEDFSAWLPTYAKKLIELPGFLGVKLLSPLVPAEQVPAVVFVLGGPGAGKGTQCARIVEAHGYVHLSAGDLLRAERASGSAQGQMIEEYIREGQIVPVEVTVKLILDAIRADGGQRFLVDGFPRNTNNLSGWQQQAGDDFRVAGVLVFDCPEEVMEERLLERGKTSGRSDDNVESIRKRFKTFGEETMPVLKYYEHQGLVTTIDGTRPPDDVWTDTTAFIDGLEATLRQGEEAVFSLHVYSTEHEKPYVSEITGRVAADVKARWGDAVKVDGRSLKVERSLKPFDIEAIRSFD